MYEVCRPWHAGLGSSCISLMRALNRISTRFRGVGPITSGGLVITSGQFFTSRSERLAALTIRQAMPAIYQYHPFVNAGGLVSYGPSQTDSYITSEGS